MENDDNRLRWLIHMEQTELTYLDHNPREKGRPQKIYESRWSEKDKLDYGLTGGMNLIRVEFQNRSSIAKSQVDGKAPVLNLG